MAVITEVRVNDTVERLTLWAPGGLHFLSLIQFNAALACSGGIHFHLNGGNLGIILQVEPESGWKVMIVDKISVRIISSACRMFDITDEGVTIVRARAPHKN